MAAWKKAGLPSLVIYTLLLFTFTHLPPQDVPAAPFPMADKVVHFGLYSLWGALAGTLVSARRFHLFGWLLLGLLLGALDETTQPLVGRYAEWGDWLADALGLTLGLGGVVRLARRRVGRAI